MKFIQTVKSTVCRTVQRYEVLFRQVKNLPRSGRPKTSINEDTSLNVLLTIQENRHVFTTELGQIHDISQKSIQSLPMAAKFKPFKCIIFMS